MTQIHSTAIISKSAELGKNVEVGPYCIIGENVQIGDNCKLESSVRIGNRTIMGTNNFIGHASLIGGEPQSIGFDASLETGVKIGNDNVFREYFGIHRATQAGQNTIVGNKNYLMAQTHLAHDVIIEDEIVMVQSAIVAGHAYLETKAFIGGMAAIHQFARVGQYSMVAGCGKIVKDVPPFTTIDGNPASIIGLNAVGLKRAGFEPEVRKQIKNAYKTIYHSALNTGQALAKLESQSNLHESVLAIITFFKNSERGVTKHR
jgi:UDP-N-acetylglucosamine acyltransferase